MSKRCVKIMAEVNFDMKNPNVLISLAHVCSNGHNPYSVFCEYIKYCLSKSPSNPVAFSDLSKDIMEYSGISIPHNVLKKCIMILDAEHSVTRVNDKLLLKGTFNASAFEQIQDNYRDKENELLKNLIEYVKDFGRHWTVDKARKNLSDVLINDALAYEIRFDDKTNDFSDATGSAGTDQMIPDRVYVGKFINHILHEDSVIKEYLRTICEGVILCIGAYQIPDNKRIERPYIKNTEFIFDTRLLLRYMGCAGDAAIQSAHELVQMIQSLGGKIYYYPHTLKEIKSALKKAQESILDKGAPDDYEMRLYVQKIKNNEMTIALLSATTEATLSNGNIYMLNIVDHEEKDRINFGFDIADFQTYVEKYTGRGRAGAYNDALSIFETHMSRSGDYSSYYGTKKRLRVFVTSNYKLIRAAIHYHNERKRQKSTQGWNNNCLPIITDTRLTCRLWSPGSSAIDVPMLHLAANAMAAQKPTKAYFDRLAQNVDEFKKNAPEYTNICLSEFFDDRITDSILRKSQGDEDKFNIGVFSSTIEEMMEFHKEKFAEEIEIERSGKADIEHKYSELKGAILSNAEKSYKKVMPYKWKIVAGISLKLDIIIPMIIAVLSTTTSYFYGDSSLLRINILSVLFLLLEKYLTKNYIKKKIISIWYQRAKSEYVLRIMGNITESEKIFESEVIDICVQNEPILNRCVQILGEKQE